MLRAGLRVRPQRLLGAMNDRSITRNDGFTLVEVLVVCLIIALLAAIALPIFIGQQYKAQDAEAKSNARNLVSQIESCKAGTEDYSLCDTGLELGTTGLPLVDGAPTTDATVGVAAATTSTFTVTAQSRHNHNRFSIARDATGAIQRTCTGTGGGCVGGTW
jgi:type IV pilus assembly protein PilA